MDENPKTPTTSPFKSPKNAIASTVHNLSSPDVSPLKIPKSPLSKPKYYDDDFFDSYEDNYSLVETDPKWGKELDSDGEPIYTPEPEINPNREYTSADAVFSITNCEDEDWLDKLGPFSSMEEEAIKINEQEEDLIYRMHRLVGERWDLIAGRIPGKTAEDIKHFWRKRKVII